MTDGRKDILIIMGRYLPGYNDGDRFVPLRI